MRENDDRMKFGYAEIRLMLALPKAGEVRAEIVDFVTVGVLGTVGRESTDFMPKFV